jgi:hypothetical protein
MHEENTNRQVKVYGELVRSNNSLPVVSADGIYDYTQIDEQGNKKSQERLNDEFKTAIEKGVTISTTENKTSVKLVEGTEFRVESGTGVKVGKWGVIVNSIQISADTDVLATKNDLTAKADKSDTYTRKQVDDAIAAIDVSEQLAEYALKTEVTNAVNAEKTRAQGVEATKADKDTTYTKTETNTLLNAKANTTDVNTALATKQDNINDLDAIRSGAAKGATAKQPATTLAGYGITDAKIVSGVITLGNNTIDPVTISTNQTISGQKTFSRNIIGNVSGNATTATTAQNLVSKGTSDYFYMADGSLSNGYDLVQTMVDEWSADHGGTLASYQCSSTVYDDVFTS